jgi:hypothetical protein
MLSRAEEVARQNGAYEIYGQPQTTQKPGNGTKIGITNSAAAISERKFLGSCKHGVVDSVQATGCNYR